MEGKKTIETFITEIINNIEKTPNWPDVDIRTYSAVINRLNDEKERIFEQDTLERSLAGKSELEKARILAEYNRRKAKKT